MNAKERQQFLAQKNAMAKRAMLAAIACIIEKKAKAPTISESRADIAETNAILESAKNAPRTVENHAGPDSVIEAIKRMSAQFVQPRQRLELFKARLNIAQLLNRGLTLEQIRQGVINQGKEIPGKSLRLKNVKRSWVVRRTGK